MILKKVITAIAVGATLVLLACSGQIEPLAGQTDCGLGMRFVNGHCLVTCTSNADCPVMDSQHSKCLNVGKDGAVCVVPAAPGKDCAYLGTDDKCVGVGTYPGLRGGTSTYSSDPPGASASGIMSSSDPYFQATAYGSQYNPNDGCKGDAQWLMVPADTNPGCGGVHSVRRCRLFGTHECRLVDGTTVDRANL
jgi:hypothetical protein